MSADEPLVTRIEGMLEHAREMQEMFQYQVEDSAHKLSRLEMAQRVAELKARIETTVPFEMSFCLTGYPEGKLIIVCAGGTSEMAQVRALVVTLLDVHAKCLAEL